MQQVHTILLEMRNTNSTVDTRMTYFQVPFVVEDALGFKFPVPSEYDYDLINAIVRHRFKEGPGSGDVIAGHCELCKMDKRSETITATTRLVPGTAIVMAIIVEASNYNSASCPMLHCESSEASPSPGGGFIWCALCSDCLVTIANKPCEFSVVHVTSGMTRHIKKDTFRLS